jgi:hypothetical protein
MVFVKDMKDQDKNNYLALLQQTNLSFYTKYIHTTICTNILNKNLN